jgi:hypothetical protein
MQPPKQHIATPVGQSGAPVPREVLKLIARTIAAGDILQAQGIYRDATGSGSRDAEMFVDELADKLKVKYPDLFAKPAASLSQLNPVVPTFFRGSVLRWAVAGSAALLLFVAAVVLFARHASISSAPNPSDSPAVPEKVGQSGAESVAAQDAVRLESDRQEEQARQLREQKERDEEQATMIQRASLPVDLNWKRIPHGYIGNDAELLYEALNNRLGAVPAKDQFETDAQYGEKLQNAVAGPLLGSLTASSLFAFAVKEHMDYDAEKGVSSCPFYDPENIDLATLGATHGEPYVGQNAFGVKVDVDVSTTKKLNLKLLNLWEFDKVAFPLSAEQARQSEDHLRLLLVGLIQPPYLAFKQDEEFPTIDNPTRATTIDETIPFSAREIWVVRDDDGEVYLKLTPWTADPERALKKVARQLAEDGPYTNILAQVTNGGDECEGSISFTDGISTRYEISFHWTGGKWKLIGGMRIVQFDGGESTRTTLRAVYGFGMEEGEVPDSVEEAFSKAYDQEARR